MLARSATFALAGVDALDVTVEADIHPGLPAFTIVGLPDVAVQESRERVRAALVNSEFEFPLRRITVNLAPADFRKAGPGFDLALAGAILAASGQVPSAPLENYALCGELGLDGSVRPVRGALAFADRARRSGREGLVVAGANAAEASLIDGLDVVGVETVRRLADFLGGDWRPPAVQVDAAAKLERSHDQGVDLADVRGHHSLKRALEVAAAGGHHMLMIGPPGSGKSMISRRMPTILPPPTLEEALETTRVHSVAGLLGGEALVARRPFRAPHHSISGAGLVGGGVPPSPGEASLAHNGVLFLDELAEFARPALEALRQPLERGSISLMRGQRTVSFPMRFTLLAATNPCPCGNSGAARRECSCHPSATHRYLSKLSAALVDRIDVIVRVDPPPAKELMVSSAGPESAEVRARVIACRARQSERLAGTTARCNADMSAVQARRRCRLRRDASRALELALDRGLLTPRGHDRVLRVARTLADLDGRDGIERSDVAEAIGYRDSRVVQASEWIAA
jgi:magnesium chelatase family protein